MVPQVPKNNAMFQPNSPKTLLIFYQSEEIVEATPEPVTIFINT